MAGYFPSYVMWFYCFGIKEIYISFQFFKAFFLRQTVEWERKEQRMRSERVNRLQKVPSVVALWYIYIYISNSFGIWSMRAMPLLHHDENHALSTWYLDINLRSFGRQQQSIYSLCCESVDGPRATVYACVCVRGGVMHMHTIIIPECGIEATKSFATKTKFHFCKWHLIIILLVFAAGCLYANVILAVWLLLFLLYGLLLATPSPSVDVYAQTNTSIIGVFIFRHTQKISKSPFLDTHTDRAVVYYSWTCMYCISYRTAGLQPKHRIVIRLLEALMYANHTHTHSHHNSLHGPT